MYLTDRDRKRLEVVHRDLVAVVERAAGLTDIGFTVTEGLRTPERQRKLVAAGASRTMNSRHLTGHAVDLAAVVDGDVRWDWPLYHKLARVMRLAAVEVNVQIEWGGEWLRFKDGPHFQLPLDKYPA